jgi:hypothetical protein
MLEKWLKSEETNQKLFNLFTNIRKNTPSLRRDLELLSSILKEMSGRSN